MNINQWYNTVQSFNKRFEKRTDVREQWEKNTEENLSLFTKKRSIWSIDQKYAGVNEKAFYLVGSSPCLKKDVKILKKVNKENSRIMCSNSSLKYLLKHDVIPDYCISLDSDDIDIPQHLDIDRDDITLFASTASPRCVLEKWKGSYYFLPYYSVSKGLRQKLKNRLGKMVPSGGNSMTEALVVTTTILGAKLVVFVANEYSFDKSYYADKDAAKQEKLETLYPTVDIMGRERWTLPALYQYAIWTDKICEDLTPPGFFIDTSFGLLGKTGTAIMSKDLDSTIQLVDNIFARKKKGDIFSIEVANMEVDGNDEGEVLRYNVSAQREQLLSFIRSRS